MKAHLDKNSSMQYSMRSLCTALTVSRSGYYSWLKRSKHAQACKPLQTAIRACHAAHKARAGAPSIHVELVAEGFDVCMRTVGRHMQKLGLRAKGCKKFKRATDANHNKLVSPNVLERQFKVAAPNQVWVADITYIRTDQGWLYLAVVIILKD